MSETKQIPALQTLAEKWRIRAVVVKGPDLAEEPAPKGSDAKPWKHFAYSVRLTNHADGPKTTEVSFGPIPYKCGVGHVRMVPRFTTAKTYTRRELGTIHRGTSIHDADDARFVPVPPTAADLLHSLIMDAEAADMPFGEWCASLGYDEDSRTALQIFLHCQAIGADLARFFRALGMQAADVAAFKEAASEY